MIKIFENPHVEIFNISEEIPDTIFAYWKGYLSLENKAAVIACNKSIEYFKSEGIKVMISDHKYLEGATQSFLEWINESYFPECLKSGLKAELILSSEHEMGNTTLELMYDEDDFKATALITKYVSNLEGAKKIAAQIVEKLEASIK